MINFIIIFFISGHHYAGVVSHRISTTWVKSVTQNFTQLGMASSSSDDASSCSDSELEEIASKASNKIRNSLQKSRNIKLRKQISKTPNKGKSDNKTKQTVKEKTDDNTLGFVIDKTPLRNVVVDDETNLREINIEMEEEKVTKKQTNKKKV